MPAVPVSRTYRLQPLFAFGTESLIPWYMSKQKELQGSLFSEFNGFLFIGQEFLLMH